MTHENDDSPAKDYVYVNRDDLDDGPVTLPNPCPACGNQTLQVEMRMSVVGPAIVAGVVSKLSAVESPWAICTTNGCGFAKQGKRVSL